MTRDRRDPGPGDGLVREHCGAFLDSIEAERLCALFELAAYTGLRRSELAGLDWADVDFATRRVHVRQAQVDDVLDDTKSEDSERIITLDKDRAKSLRAWRKTQLAERLAWGADWTNSGRRVNQLRRRPGWEIEQLADELAELFGGRVDLVSSRALHPLLRPSVLAEARPVYAA